ncbi:MAG: glycosyltransferase [Bacteroidota bacterium]
MNILHVAPINVAGVPYAMMDMQRRFGHSARLITLHRNTLTFPEDICLDLPLPRNPLAHWWRQHKHANPVVPGHTPTLRKLEARNPAERLYFQFDDWRRAKRIAEAIERHALHNFDIIHYDGGLDFFRDAHIAREWKSKGKKIVCHYMGSDLRVRGVHPVLDSLSDLNLTNESDHLLLHPNIHYVFIPFDTAEFSLRQSENGKLRIIHSPSNRHLKGTRFILPVMEQLKQQRDVEFVLAENMPHEELLALKMTCDVAIEQVGNLGGTGYGRNSLETLAMGIPTITEMTPDYTTWLPENPFILATPETLLEKLLHVIDDPELRRDKRVRGREWVEKYHSYETVHQRLQALYKDHGIL